jgi:hypothetical protein
LFCVLDGRVIFFVVLSDEVRQYLANFYVRGGGPSSLISFFSSSAKSLSKASMATDGNIDDDLDALVPAFAPPALAIVTLETFYRMQFALSI